MVKGIKQTEIGLIPEDWEVVEIKDITNHLTNGFVGIAKTHYTESDKGVTYVQGFNVEENSFNYTGIKKVTREFHLSHLRSSLKYGDLLTVQTGDVGLTSFVPQHLEGANCHALIISRYKKTQVDSKYVSFYLNSKQGRNRLKDIETGTTMKHINVGDFQYFQIPLPSLPEQEAIAGALSDADAWIESLEQLIAKKRLIKQGAMQELLTPKEGWEVKKLGEVGKIYGGLSGKTKQDFGSGNSYYIPFMNVMKNVVIDKTFIEKVNLKQGETQNRVLKNDLLFNGSSETPEELGISSVILEDIEDLFLNSFCFGFRVFDNNVSPIFLSYLMRSPYGRQVIYYLAQGATRYNLSKANFFNLEISFPKSLTEQTRIATILSDMDAELEALEQHLHKARQIKQGMMQELLTGRVRLV